MPRFQRIIPTILGSGLLLAWLAQSTLPEASWILGGVLV
jgi:hypothetical protein